MQVRSVRVRIGVVVRTVRFVVHLNAHRWILVECSGVEPYTSAPHGLIKLVLDDCVSVGISLEGIDQRPGNATIGALQIVGSYPLICYRAGTLSIATLGGYFGNFLRNTEANS